MRTRYYPKTQRTQEEWRQGYEAYMGAKMIRSGSEWRGPCPLCGGTRRFCIPRNGLVLCYGVDCVRRVRSEQDKAKWKELNRLVWGDDEKDGHWADATIQRWGRRTETERQSTQKQAPPPEKTALAGRLWAACAAADGTPGHRYLTSRGVWPPAGLGRPLPTDVRWLEAASAPPRAAGWPGLPPGAAGAAAFAWRKPAEADAVQAVSLEALGADGQRAQWTDREGQVHERWRRTFGPRTGAVFAVRCPDGDPGVVALCEGEVSALALALAGGCGEVRAVGGTSGMTLAAGEGAGGRRLALIPDGDESRNGQKQAWKLLEALSADGRAAVADDMEAEGDPADWIREWVEERAGLMELDAEVGLERPEARECWEYVLKEIEGGARLVPSILRQERRADGRHGA